MWTHILVLLPMAMCMIISSTIRRPSKPLSKRFENFKLMSPEERKRLWMEPTLDQITQDRKEESALSLHETVQKNLVKELLLRIEEMKKRHAQEITDLHSQFESQLRVKNQEIDNLRNQLSYHSQSYESKLITSEYFMQELQETITEQKKVQARMEDRIEKMKEVREQMGKEIDDASRQVEDLKSELEEKDESIQHLKEQINHTNTELADKETRLQVVSQDLISAQIMIHVLRSRLLKYTSTQYLAKFDRKMSAMMQNKPLHRTKHKNRGGGVKDEWMAGWKDYQAKL